MNHALHATRAGGHVGFVGVAHGVSIELIWSPEIDPGKVFDLHLPLERAADGYRAMDQRDAIKVLLQP